MTAWIFVSKKAKCMPCWGENGAGKTTLMNILYGLLQPDSGRISWAGRPVRISSPSQAISLGIGMVHQHFMLVPVMSVVENVIIGRETTRRGFLDLKRAARDISDLSSRFGLKIDPWRVVGDLPVGVRQRVEILKALYRQAEVLILDEPTAVLTPEEAENLFEIMTVLAEQGKSIIFITHKLKEVMRSAHRITVLRGGRVVGTTTPEASSEAELASLMVGRDVALTVSKKPSRPGDVILKVSDLQVTGPGGRPAVRGVSFDLQSGEIFGLAGVQGNGQTELVEALTGLIPIAGGTVELEGRDVTGELVKGLGSKVAHVPEDRHERGMVDVYSLADNLVLNQYRRPPFSRWGLIDQQEVRRNAERLMAEYDVRAPSPYTPMLHLSGGNQQRMVVAREFSRPGQLLIASQPTRGLDVGSIEFIHQRILKKCTQPVDDRDIRFIHQRILKKRDQGCAVLLVSTELDEVLALADRIGVIFKGKLVNVRDAAQTSRKEIGLWMAGIET